MPKYTTPNDIELRSEAVREILGKPPRWLIRFGITLIFIIVVGLFVGSYFFKYPDIIPAPITVTTENLPAAINARISSKINAVFVSEKQTVSAGQILVYLDNPAKWEDVLTLKQQLIASENRKEEHSPPSFSNAVASLALGDLQTACLAWIKAEEDYQYFVQANYHRKKIAVIEQQIRTQKSILQKAQKQLIYSIQQTETARQTFAIDSSLFAKKIIANAEYQQAKNSYLQQLQAHENAKLGVDNQNMSILQSEQTIFDLEQQRSEQLNQLQIALTAARDQLTVQIKIWEQSYLLVAPCSGVATFTKYWQENQNVAAGEIVVTVVPNAQATISGKILLPPQGAGKVKEGQLVNVKFDNFPYMEYGMVKALIKNISLVPIALADNQKAYILEVVFPDKLQTNYGKELTFSQEMTGSAEIITEDLRLFDKFINPIKAALKK